MFEWVKKTIKMYIPKARPAIVYEMEKRAEKKKEVMRLVEAQIAGNVDLSPEEMVDAAFLMVDKIDRMIYGQKEDK